MSGLTAQLGKFVSDAATSAYPDEIRPIVLSGFIDCIGTMIAGHSEPAVGILEKVIGGDGAEAWTCASAGRSSVHAAALLNGTAAHALDYDDVALGAHPSAVLVPAILAEGEASGASGDQLVRAYIAGYEVWGELTKRDKDRHHEKGWHPTAVFGSVAAAASCSVLLGHDPQAASRAIAISASLAGGIVANFGTMTKPMHVGRAAQNGVLAARLAGAGFTAAEDAIEHSTGFLSAISPSGRVCRSSETPLGVSWHILENRLNIKRYPTCYSTHRSIDGAIELMKRHDVRPNSIDRINVTMGATQATILRNSRPQTGLDAKFSAQFAMAAAVLSRAVGLAELRDDYVRQPEIQTLMQRVVVDTTEETDPADPIFSINERVRFLLRDGKVLDSGEIRHAKGHAKRPMSIDELRKKFADCLDYGGALPLADRLFATLENLPELNKVPVSVFEELRLSADVKSSPNAPKP